MQTKHDIAAELTHLSHENPAPDCWVMRRRRIVFTIVSGNYIAYAATLMQSIREFHPDVDRCIVLADSYREFPEIDLAAELLACDELGIGEIDKMQFWYTVIEFNTAIKPFVFRKFFERDGYDEAVYIDPDILLLGPLTEVFTGLAEHNIVLTPHMMFPLQDGKEPSDLTIMKSGVYNLGFLGARNDEYARNLMRWWSDRCFMHCRVDIAGNMFTDQRWMDLAPVFVPSPLILRHIGYNVAYWNLAHRDVRRDDQGTWRVNEDRLVFFHFSGINPGNQKSFSKHQNRFTADTLGAVRDLCDEYRGRVIANGWSKYARVRYSFGTFPNGRPIEDAMRRWVTRAVDVGRFDPRKPLGLDASFFDQADEEAAAKGAVVTRFMFQFWLDRQDLRQAFDIFTPKGCAEYIEWFVNGDARFQGVDGRSIAAGRKLAGRLSQEGDGPVRLVSPPWPAICRKAWDGGSIDVGRFLEGDIEFSVEGAKVLLPLQMALVWELRSDLQQHFDLRSVDSIYDFIAWAITNGVAESSMDPPSFSISFIEFLARSSALTDHYGDVPITIGMIITRTSGSMEKGYGMRRRFPVDRPARLAHGLWYAYMAPQRYNWPVKVVQPVLDYFSGASQIQCGQFRLSRALLAIWEMREDVQQRYPLNSDQSIRGYLLWLLRHGLEEMDLSLQQLGPELPEFLLASSRRVPNVLEIHEIIHQQRADLLNTFDVQSESGRQGFANWVATHFSSDYDHPTLTTLFKTREETREQADLVPYMATVALTGQWVAPSGRGEDVRCSAASLKAAHFTDFVVIDMDSLQVLRPDGEAIAEGTPIQVDLNIVHMNADTAYHDWQRLRSINLVARKSVGFWAWELEQLPSFWRFAFGFYDEIWASSSFAQQAFTQERLRPVRLMPMAVIAPPTPQILSRRQLGVPQDATMFLFVFDFRSYASRKNPCAVVSAFLKAFPAGDEKTCLYIKTLGGGARPEGFNRLNDLCNDPRILLRDVEFERDEVIGLIAACDAFVSLHRSEGFGRGPAEAMLLGRPLIVTDYSGTADFATADCACVVDYDLVPVGMQEYPGVETQRWAAAVVEQAALHMRWIHEHPEAANQTGARGREQVVRLLDPSVIGAKMVKAIDELIGKALVSTEMPVAAEPF